MNNIDYRMLLGMLEGYHFKNENEKITYQKLAKVVEMIDNQDMQVKLQQELIELEKQNKEGE